MTKEITSILRNRSRIQGEKVFNIYYHYIENDTLVNTLMQNIKNVKKYTERKFILSNLFI
jgi:hypothetical protein